MKCKLLKHSKWGFILKTSETVKTNATNVSFLKITLKLSQIILSNNISCD